MASIASRCLLALALTTSVASEPVPLDLAIEGDDECESGDGRCSFNALQLRAQRQEDDCHDSVPGEACYDELMWAKTDDMIKHPEWYAPAGITVQSSDPEVQAFVYSSHPDKCPRPCSAVAKTPLPQPPPSLPKLWCSQNSVAPKLWAPAAAKGPLQIKILSYNTFWWSLFNLRNGNGNSAGKLIQKFNAPQAFDVMGFQECEDPGKILNPVGLSATFEGILGEHAICMAYNKEAWALLASGIVDVSEDMPTRYYGRRASQWMRLVHRTTGQKLFFVNHHGPLSVNSGGVCGGEATAFNILQLMARKAEVGDVLVLVGDFNANAASLTVQTMWSNLVQAFAGASFGGVDNIFTNVASSNVIETRIMGNGGSDHDAVYAVLQVDSQPEAEVTVIKLSGPANSYSPIVSAKELVGQAKPGYDWQTYWCGQIEHNMGYIFEGSFWSKSITGEAALSPDHCCRECQASGQQCQSWMWNKWSATANGKECLMNGDPSPAKRALDGSVSGLSYTAAYAHALASATRAKTYIS